MVKNMAKRKQTDIQSSNNSQSPQRTTTGSTKRGKNFASNVDTVAETMAAASDVLSTANLRPTRAKSGGTVAANTGTSAKVQSNQSKSKSQSKTLNTNTLNTSKSKQMNKSNNNNNNNRNTTTKKSANISTNSNKTNTNKSDDNDCPTTRASRPTTSNQQQKRLKDNNSGKQDFSSNASPPTTSKATAAKVMTKAKDKSESRPQQQKTVTQKTTKAKTKSGPKTRNFEPIIDSYSQDSNKSDEIYSDLIQQQMEGMDEDTKRIQEAEAALRSLTGDIDVNTEETDTEDVEEADKPMFEDLFAKKESQKAEKSTNDCAANAWKDVVTLSATSSSCGSLSETSPQHSPPVTPENSDHNVNSPADSRASISTVNESTDQTIDDSNNQNIEIGSEVNRSQTNFDEMENLMKIEEQCNAFIQSNKSVEPSVDRPIDDECQSTDDDDEDDDSSDSSDDTEDESCRDNRQQTYQRTDQSLASTTIITPIVPHLVQTSLEAIRQPSAPAVRQYVKDEDPAYSKSSCCVETSPHQNRIIKAHLQQQPQYLNSPQTDSFSSAFKVKAPEHKYFDCKYQKSMSESMASTSCHSPPNPYMSTKESSNETNIGLCHQNLLPTTTTVTAGPQMMSTQYPEDESMTSASNLSFPGSPPNG